jgi:uncharacterized protein
MKNMCEACQIPNRETEVVEAEEVSLTMRNNTKENRYELDVDGHLAIAEYTLQDDKLIITHVEVPQELRGQGIAAKVMQGVVKDATARGLAIVPVCSYAAAYMQRRAQ